MQNIKQQIFDYKYNGNYLNNYKQLISIMEEVTEHIAKPGMKTMAINMILESRNHRMGMHYSKGYEMANELQNQIKQTTYSLIQALPEKLQPALHVLTEKLLIKQQDIEEQKYKEWIRFAEPWHFFIIEKQHSSKLFRLDWFQNTLIEIPTDEYFNKRLKSNTQGIYETIYASINSYHIKNWLNK